MAAIKGWDLLYIAVSKYEQCPSTTMKVDTETT